MADKFHIFPLNGQNLNLLDIRKPDKYGYTIFDDIIENISKLAASLGAEFSHIQSNAKHVLINCIHHIHRDTDFIVIKPTVFTYTSFNLRNVLLAANILFIEFYLSNMHVRKPFRHCSYLSDVAVGVICGLGRRWVSFCFKNGS